MLNTGLWRGSLVFDYIWYCYYPTGVVCEEGEPLPDTQVDIADVRLMLIGKRERTKSQGFCYQNYPTTLIIPLQSLTMILLMWYWCCREKGSGRKSALLFAKHAIFASFLIFYACSELLFATPRGHPAVPPHQHHLRPDIMWYCLHPTDVVYEKGEDEKCLFSPFPTPPTTPALGLSNMLSDESPRCVIFLYAQITHYTLHLCNLSLISCINVGLECIFTHLPIPLSTTLLPVLGPVF